MGVDGRAGRGGHVLVAEQTGQLGSSPRPVVSGRVEDVGERTPARPAGQDGLLVGGRCAPLVLDGTQDAQGGQVGAGLRYFPGRGQVPLARGPEIDWPAGVALGVSPQARRRVASTVLASISSSLNSAWPVAGSLPA